jgi:hypothetical protein
MERTYLIGDIGGHHDELWAALVDLGTDPDTYALPQDVSVVQVGDLIGRGPDELATIELARAMQERNPGHWIQLAGNHETNQLGVHEFAASPDPQAVAVLVEWAASGGIHLAASIGDNWLITHAGMSVGVHDLIGEPSTAPAAAQLIDAAWSDPALRYPIVRPGIMVSGRRTDRRAGVVWAEAGSELYRPWLFQPMPFSQIHGHTSAYWWSKSAWSAPADVIKSCSYDPKKRHVIFTPPGSKGASIRGIDPSFSQYTHATWSPLVITGTARVGGPALIPDL